MGHELRHHTEVGHATAASLHHRHHERQRVHAAAPGRHTRVESSSTHAHHDDNECVRAGCSSHLVERMLPEIERETAKLDEALRARDVRGILRTSAKLRLALSDADIQAQECDEPARAQLRAVEVKAKMLLRQVSSPHRSKATSPLRSFDGPLEDVEAGSLAVSPEVHREGLIEQVLRIPDDVRSYILTGIARGMDAVNQSEKPPSSSWLPQLLATAASAVIAAVSAETVGWLVAPLLAAGDVGGLVSFVRSAVKSGFHLTPGPSKQDLLDLKIAFGEELKSQLDLARAQLTSEWSKLRDRIATLSTSELAAVVEQLIPAAAQRADQLDALHEAVANDTVVGWTNFLARAMHGGMSNWDYWQENGSEGAIRLKGAADIADGDPTHGNVDPRAIGWALDDNAPNLEHYGILQISLDLHGRLLEAPGFGMKIDHLPEAVLRRLRTFGTVRNLKVNKIVRIISLVEKPLIPVAAVLITADGYVRRATLGEFQRVHVKLHSETPWGQHQEYGECMDRLMEGRETVDCHEDHVTDEKTIVSLAELAQDLPLSMLEGR